MLKFFSIFDKKSGAYWDPQCYKSEAEAIRSLILGLETGKGTLCRFPEDYVLYYVGEFDQSKGIFTLESLQVCPRPVIEVSSLVASAKTAPPEGPVAPVKGGA